MRAAERPVAGVNRALTGLALRAAYEEFLKRWEWRYFLTLTFRSHQAPADSERAWKSFRYFINNINCWAYGRNWSNRSEGATWIAALETHQSGEFHFHLMLGLPDIPFDLSAEHHWRAWLLRKFGMPRFEPINWEGSVARYIVKTASTSNDIELSPTLAKALSQA